MTTNVNGRRLLVVLALLLPVTTATAQQGTMRV